MLEKAISIYLIFKRMRKRKMGCVIAFNARTMGLRFSLARNQRVCH
jgi:hypothetical protein